MMLGIKLRTLHVPGSATELEPAPEGEVFWEQVSSSPLASSPQPLGPLQQLAFFVPGDHSKHQALSSD